MLLFNLLLPDMAGRPVETPPEVGFNLGIPSEKRPPIPGRREGADEPNEAGPPEDGTGGVKLLLFGLGFSLPTNGALRSFVTALRRALPCCSLIKSEKMRLCFENLPFKYVNV